MSLQQRRGAEERIKARAFVQAVGSQDKTRLATHEVCCVFGDLERKEHTQSVVSTRAERRGHIRHAHMHTHINMFSHRPSSSE